MSYKSIIDHQFLLVFFCVFQFLSNSYMSMSSFTGFSPVVDVASVLSCRARLVSYPRCGGCCERPSPTKTKNIKFIWPIFKYHWSSSLILKKTMQCNYLPGPLVGTVGMAISLFTWYLGWGGSTMTFSSIETSKFISTNLYL